MTVWPSGLRRYVKAVVRKGVGSNPTAVNLLARNVQTNTHRLINHASLKAKVRCPT